MTEDKLAKLQAKIFASYMAKTPKCKQMYERAHKSLAGGTSGNGSLYQPYPLYMTHGRGSKTYDVDGNEYVDCLLSAGPLILGHCHPEVMEGIKREIDRGLLLHNNDLAIEAAELMQEIIPCAEKVRFVNTGTDAIMFAAKFARAFTRKNKIIKFYGHFHGEEDQFMIATTNNRDELQGAGIPRDSVKNTVLLRYDDIEAVRCKLDEDSDIAAVFLDAQMNYGGLWGSKREYLIQLRQLTKERGVVLVFDEVLTGFRLALGGAQEYFGVTPDLAVYAKGLAGGEKLAAIAGKDNIMSVTIPEGPFASGAKKTTVHQSGTFRDGTVALAAAIAAMKVYRKLSKNGEYAKLHQMGRKLKLNIEDAFRKRGMGCHVNNLGPSLRTFLTDLEPSFDTYCNLDKRPYHLFLLSVIAEGVILAVPSLGTTYLSFAHTEEDLQRISEAVNAALDKNSFEEILS